jgi:streptogramin lyase
VRFRIPAFLTLSLLLASSAFAADAYVLLHQWPVERTTSVFVDAAGDVWTTNAARRRVERWDRYGALRSAWDVPSPGASEAAHPAWLAAVTVGPRGDCYVLDAAAHRVIQLDAAGALVRWWGGLGEGPGQFCFPKSLALDAAGNLLVADGWNARVQVFAPDGAHLPGSGAPADSTAALEHATGIALGDSGLVWVADHAGDRVVAFDAAGRRARAIAHDLDDPSHVAVDAEGRVFVADRTGRRLQAFDRHGALESAWTDARLGWIDGLGVGADGLVSVASGDRVLVFARAGSVVGGRVVGVPGPPEAAR